MYDADDWDDEHDDGGYEEHHVVGGLAEQLPPYLLSQRLEVAHSREMKLRRLPHKVVDQVVQKQGETQKGHAELTA